MDAMTITPALFTQTFLNNQLPMMAQHLSWAHEGNEQPSHAASTQIKCLNHLLAIS
jgi:hypothetical protein